MRRHYPLFRPQCIGTSPSLLVLILSLITLRPFLLLPLPSSRYLPIPTTPFSWTVLIQEPRQWSQAIQNLYNLLKPGGIICFRDYGRYDMTQLRFKKERLLEDNFYIRGDGTRVYFFDEGGNLRRVCLQLPRFLCLCSSTSIPRLI